MLLNPGVSAVWLIRSKDVAGYVVMRRPEIATPILLKLCPCRITSERSMNALPSHLISDNAHQSHTWLTHLFARFLTHLFTGTGQVLL